LLGKSNKKGVKRMAKQNEVKIFSTTEYDSFKLLKKQNRGIKNGHVNRLVKSINKKNLLKDFPIVVSRDFTILDGQHRFEACKKLEIPIWYRVSSDMDINDLPIINSIYLGWKLSDYLDKYIDSSNIDYIKFKRLMDENDDLFGITQILQFVFGYAHSGTRSNGNYNGSPSVAFKNGDFIYPEDDFYVREKINIVKSFSPYTKLTKTFISAVLALMKITDYDHNRMLNNLKKCGHLLKTTTSVKDYFIMFNEIYNHGKSKNTIYLKYK
jgi:hypothetical protein